MGLSLKNVKLSIVDSANGKVLWSDLGEMLFTHFGISGPLVLTASSYVRNINSSPDRFVASIDLKPALSFEELDKRILRDFEEAINKQFKNALNKLLPAKMIPIIIELSNIDPDKKVNEISKEERRNLVMLLKHLPLTITGLRGWNEAIITKGGVSVKDINPSTMESKIIENLYFCGEVLDLDAMTGGYNLQIAWSTGYLAGSSC
jgi:predicted Rossmann fold flavoprotein